MKHCPACHARYADDTSFCATDGTALVSDAPAAMPAPAPVAAPTRGVSPLAAVAMVLGTLAVCAMAWLFVTQQQRTDAMEASVRLADARAAEAERQAAESAQIARDTQLADAEARAQRAETAPPPMPLATGGAFTTVAWADSPRDGYLALRSRPSTSTGERLARIPHGAQIALGACNPASQVPGGRLGQWCRTRWGGMEGWAFTAFMQF